MTALANKNYSGATLDFNSTSDLVYMRDADTGEVEVLTRSQAEGFVARQELLEAKGKLAQAKMREALIEEEKAKAKNSEELYKLQTQVQLHDEGFVDPGPEAEQTPTPTISSLGRATDSPKPWQVDKSYQQFGPPGAPPESREGQLVDDGLFNRIFGGSKTRFNK